MERFDVIVIGGGHAGAEAAALAARAGARTLLLTQRLATIGQMSCNPAIGGIAKGTVAREVDALGGVMGRATDRSRIQFRMLNRSKGPAVWSPRAQCDRRLYREAVRSLLDERPGLSLAEGTVARLLVEGGRVVGVETSEGTRVAARSVVVTAGTFLRGRIHVGTSDGVPAGRAGDAPSVELASALAALGLEVARFKTGTPPRIDGRTVDYARLARQDGDPEPYRFSWFVRAVPPAQRPCWLTWAGEPVKAIIARHLHESALYGGAISGLGPRYCPSIEDKVVKFADAPRHQVFLEPEGLDADELYVNGLSTSLPAEVQLAFLRAVPGLEQVEMTRAGYAIEYDWFPPTQLERTLESRAVMGLFFAGQVNGTTGYEEAAGQGVVAGINAAARALDLDPLVLGRDEAYCGLLVDDLVTRGVDEPYRLFTSRSEYRLLLRQDNALRRLMPVAERYRLLTEAERRVAYERLEAEERLLERCGSAVVRPEQVNELLEAHGERGLQEPVRLSALARRPAPGLAALLEAAGEPHDAELVDWVGIELRYDGYLAREQARARRLREMEDFVLPEELDYLGEQGLSYEAREKLHRLRPATLGQAGRVPGVSPADLQGIVVAVLRWRGGAGCT